MLGHSGTGQEHNLNILKEATLYDPDLVVFTLCSNDFCDDDPALRVLPVTEFRGLVRHGYLMLAFAVFQRDPDESLQDLWGHCNGRPRMSPALKAWQGTLERVRAARDFAGLTASNSCSCISAPNLPEICSRPDRRGAELVSMHSLPQNLSWDMEKSLNRITSYCRKHNIPLISLLEPLVVAQNSNRFCSRCSLTRWWPKPSQPH